MALFVQIDHFRKTDQKPTVKNHLFSISWFRSFNRTSFQQQLKQPFRQFACRQTVLQSYILSTTTETYCLTLVFDFFASFNRTSFQQQLKPEPPAFLPSPCSKLQSYILSTTTETDTGDAIDKASIRLQSYILSTTTETHQ